MEIWDLYDADGRLTGETMIRGEEVPEGKYHLVMHFWVLRSDGKVLTQKRAKDVSQWPSYWSTTGGSALTGENSTDCLYREVQEEIGLDLHRWAAPKLVLQRKLREFLTDVFVLKADIALEEINIGPEVEDVRYLNREEMEAMIKKDEMVPFSKAYLDALFDA